MTQHQDTTIIHPLRNNKTSLQKWSPMNFSKLCGMRCKQAAKKDQHHCFLSKLPVYFALKATLNIDRPVLSFVTDDENLSCYTYFCTVLYLWIRHNLLWYFQGKKYSNSVQTQAGTSQPCSEYTDELSYCRNDQVNTELGSI